MSVHKTPETNHHSDQYTWAFDHEQIDWNELSDLYRIAPLGNKAPHDLETVFTNSMYKCFAYTQGRLVATGRALADGLDCAYIADVAVHPDHQGNGIGTTVIKHLISLAEGHKKVILYAKPGKEGFYAKIGFVPMKTAMAIWHNLSQAIADGLLRDKS